MIACETESRVEYVYNFRSYLATNQPQTLTGAIQRDVIAHFRFPGNTTGCYNRFATDFSMVHFHVDCDARISEANNCELQTQ